MRAMITEMKNMGIRMMSCTARKKDTVIMSIVDTLQMALHKLRLLQHPHSTMSMVPLLRRMNKRRRAPAVHHGLFYL